MAESTRVLAIVSGDVQGVGFRVSTRAEAQRAGLAGFVRNREDGSVEAEIEGTDAAVQSMLEWLSHGPPGSRVDAVDTRVLEVSGQPGFGIRR